MNRQLRPDQQAALEALRDTVRGGVRRIVVQSPTGWGKTILAAGIVESALERKKRCTFVVSSISLIDQTVEKFYSEGIRDIGVIQASHPMENWAAPVQIASVQTLDSRGVVPDSTVNIFDECVRAGTKIATPLGDRNIEDLRIGDQVFNAIGIGTVRALSRRRRPIIKMELSNGRQLGITRWHPVFTEAGWRHAGAVEKRARIFSQQRLCSLWGEIPSTARHGRDGMGEKKVLLPAVRENRHEVMAADAHERAQGLSGVRERVRAVGGEKRSHSGGEILEMADLLRHILLEEVEQSDARRGHDIQGEGIVESHWSPAEGTWRQWMRSADTSEDFACASRGRMGAGSGGSHQEASRIWLSDQLQNRRSEPADEDWHRGRWWLACCTSQASAGREEGRYLGDVGVDDISGHESDGDVDVFNIDVTGHPSYFAEGILVHNCHVLYKAHKAWLGNGGNAVFIGLSATPYTRGLGGYFETLLTPMTTRQAIAEKILVPGRYFAHAHHGLKDKLKRVKKTVSMETGETDYAIGQTSGIMRENEIAADVVDTWRKRWGKGKTLVFAVDIGHAMDLHARFEHAGVRCAYQDANTKRNGFWTTGEKWMDGRADIARKFNTGEIDVVVSVGTLTTGVDWDVRYIGLARPTKSEILYKQIIGRGLRPGEGKEFCIVADHGGVSYGDEALGFAEDIEYDELHKKEQATERKHATPVLKPKTCLSCGILRTPGFTACQNCGFEPRPVNTVYETDDELEYIDRSTKPKGAKREWSIQEKADFFAQLKSYARQKSYASGWAANKYRDKFGTWPNDPCIKHAVSQAPTPQTLSWIRSTNIRWAKSKRNPQNGMDMGDFVR